MWALAQSGQHEVSHGRVRWESCYVFTEGAINQTSERQRDTRFRGQEISCQLETLIKAAASAMHCENDRPCSLVGILNRSAGRTRELCQTLHERAPHVCHGDKLS